MKRNYFFLLILSLLMISINAISQNIEHIEPPYWWAEMENDTLQIMLHGNNIGLDSISINSKNIDIILIEKPINKNYTFLYLNISNTKSGAFTINLHHPKSKTTDSIIYQLKARTPRSKDRVGFSSEDVVYLIMSDRFANGDLTNDEHHLMLEKINRADQGGRHGGDIQGMINHLDYLEKLGITTIWNTPLLEDNVPTFSYHGYAISDYYNIDPRYGSNKDYRKLSEELHKRKMKLIMDAVTNHCSSSHWWMEDLPYEDWIHQFPKFQRSNYRMTTQYDPYRSDSDFKLCEKGWFDTTMPDLNQANPHLIRYLAQNTIWWMEYANLDGLRVDTYSYNDKHGIAYWTKRIVDEYPNTNIVGEIWMDNQAQISYWQTNNTLSGNYDTHLPTVMDFPLFNSIPKAINQDQESWNQGMIKIYNNFSNDFVYADPSGILVFAENHDTDRLLNVMDNDIDKYKLTLALLLTTRGTPQIYYGTEIGLSGTKNKGDGDIRKDFPGGWQSDTINLFEPSERNIYQTSIYDFTNKLLNWRKTKQVIHHGKMIHYLPVDNVYVYFRYSEDDLVMIILNNSRKSIKIDRSSYSEIITKDMKFRNIMTSEQVYLHDYEIKPKSSMILELINN